MQEETMGYNKDYFSSDSIRNRYAEHIEKVSSENVDPLLDIARATVYMMRLDGKSEERTELRKKFHFSDDVIDKLVEE